jgi:hypothetical protein
VVVLEYIIAMPIVFYATLAIFEFVILGLLIQAGTVAAIEAAREGAKVYPSSLPVTDPGGEPSYDPDDDDDISDRIALVAEQYLGLFGIDVEPTAVVGRSTARVDIDRGGVTATRGDSTITCNLTGPAATASEITVTVCFNYVDTTNAQTQTGYGNPLPDWLSFFGFSMAGTRFQLTARQALE